jgi:hypothetical protein
VLIVGFVVWIGNRDDEVTSPTVPSSSTSVEPSTTPAPTTEVTTTTVEATTTTAEATTTTEATPTTTIPVFALPEPGQSKWIVPISSVPSVETLTMDIVSNDGEVSIYDGQADDLRCVAVIGPGERYTGWCGPAGEAARFVADRGAAPLLVEIGPDRLDVELLEQASTWTVPTNACTTPMSVILSAVAPGPLPVTGVACAGEEAFVGIGTLLFGEARAPDGGGILVGEGDEGWDVIGGFGTSIDCDGWPDGVDRCTLFGVESELFEALLPVPPADAIAPSEGVIRVEDATDTVRGWIGDETDPTAIESILLGELDDPDAEVPASVTWALGPGADLDLLVVEVPQFDDSIQSESWAIWFRDGGVVRATSWLACARGLAGDFCV